MAKNPLRNKYVAIGQWDASVTNLANNASASCTTGSVFIPEGALITKAYYYVETTFADGNDDSAQLSLGITGSTAAFVASIAIASAGTNGVAGGQWDAGIHHTLIGAGSDEEGDNAETQLENAKNLATSMLHITANSELLLTTNDDEAVETGKLTLYVEYVLTGDLA
jgi:hypothetical protein